jgi:hypothetical protein
MWQRAVQVRLFYKGTAANAVYPSKTIDTLCSEWGESGDVSPNHLRLRVSLCHRLLVTRGFMHKW